jgi:16S rRNA (guanine1207-N2)-methyltransferase
MTMLLYGRPPAVFDPPSTATQTSPLIPGSTALETVAPGSADGVMLYAPPGAVERRYTLALALKALKPGGRLDVMAPKDKGGSRLGKELKAFGLEVAETAKAHHRRCIVVCPAAAEGWTRRSRRARRAWFRGWRPGRSRASSPGTASIRARRCWRRCCRR